MVLICLCSCRMWSIGGVCELWHGVTDFHSDVTGRAICSMDYCRIKYCVCVCV